MNYLGGDCKGESVCSRTRLLWVRPSDEDAMAFGIIGEEALARGRDRAVEGVFRSVDVDALG